MKAKDYLLKAVGHHLSKDAMRRAEVVVIVNADDLSQGDLEFLGYVRCPHCGLPKSDCICD